MKHQNRRWPLAFSSLLILPIFILATQETSEDASPIYYETSLARTFSTAAAKQLHKGCLYHKKKYLSGEEVQTEQPCLRCVCGKKGVLICTLKICTPGNFTGTPSSQCQVIREPNTCCPKIQCVNFGTSPTPLEGHNDTNHDHHADHAVASNEIKSSVKSVPLISLESSLFTVNLDKEGANKSEEAPKSNPLVSISHMFSRNTTILQTVPSSSFPDKERPGEISLALHAQPSRESYVSDLLSGFGKHCFVNGTFYAEGSAIGSSSFCEYCYCIRGKRMCIRPRCHLSILGCLPRYTTEFACCPTSYACGNEALSTPNNSKSSPNGKWSLFYALDEKLNLSNASDLSNSNEFDAENQLRFQEEAQPPTTTIRPSETKTDAAPSTTIGAIVLNNQPLGSHSRMTDCVLDGVSYKAGDSMPSDAHCTHCYCAMNGTRICKAIQCSLLLEGHCIPVIPEGHCCPLSYTCDTKKVDSPISSPATSSHKEESQISNQPSVQFKQTAPVPQGNSIEESSVEAGAETTSEPVTTTELNTTPGAEITKLGLVDNEKERSAQEELKVFRLFASLNEDNDAKPTVNNYTQAANEIVLNANDTTELKSTIKPLTANTLEARNLSDDPKLEEYSQQLAKTKTEHETISANNANGTANSIKLENVAHFLSNFFNVLGLTGKTGTDHRTPAVDVPRQPLPEQSSPNSVMLVEDDAHVLPSMVLSSTGDQVEIVTAQPPALSSFLDANKLHSQELVVGASMPSVQVIAALPTTHVETVKSVRDLPHGSSNYLSKNILLDKANHNKMPTFSNGWRAIPILKSRPKPPQQVSPMNRPTFTEKKEENLNKTESPVSIAPVAITTVKPEMTSEATNANKHHSSDTTPQPADISKVKCVLEGKEYENHAILPMSKDPCIYCRCFYGKQICQEQKCPSPPSLGCVGERVTNQCCPVYTCRLGGSSNDTLVERSSAVAVSVAIDATLPDKSPIRKSPQFPPETTGPSEANKLITDGGQNDAIAKSRFESEPNNVPPSALPLNRPPPPPPFLPQNQPRISFPFDPIARPLDLAYGSRLENRVHFPHKNKLSNSPPNLPPGLIMQQPHLQNPILNLHKPLLNRPLFGHPPPPNSFKHGSKVEDTRGGLGPIGSPIRPMPQSPTQLEKTKLGDEAKVNPKPRPPLTVSTEVTSPSLSSTSTTSNLIQQQQFTTGQPSGPWDILQVSGCNIYGKMYKTGEEVGQLSTACKKCICSPQGVQCRNVC